MRLVEVRGWVAGLGRVFPIAVAFLTVLGAALTVLPGAPALAADATISGNVRAEFGPPLSSMVVVVRPVGNSSSFLQEALTDQLGNYSWTGPAGGYEVVATGHQRPFLGFEEQTHYLDQYYDHKGVGMPSYVEPTVVSTLGGDRTDISFSLHEGVFISGSITDIKNHPVRDFTMLRVNTSFLGDRMDDYPDSSGQWKLGPFPPDFYYVGIEEIDTWPTTTFWRLWYDGVGGLSLDSPYAIDARYGDVSDIGIVYKKFRDFVPATDGWKLTNNAKDEDSSDNLSVWQSMFGGDFRSWLIYKLHGVDKEFFSRGLCYGFAASSAATFNHDAPLLSRWIRYTPSWDGEFVGNPLIELEMWQILQLSQRVTSAQRLNYITRNRTGLESWSLTLYSAALEKWIGKLKAEVAAEPQVLSIASKSPVGGKGGGHALVAYKVTGPDVDGEYLVSVYDSNWPGEERIVHVTPTRGEWYYDLELRNNPVWTSFDRGNSIDFVSPSVVAEAYVNRPTRPVAGSTLFWASEIGLLKSQDGAITGVDGDTVYQDIPGAMLQFPTGASDIDNPAAEEYFTVADEAADESDVYVSPGPGGRYAVAFLREGADLYLGASVLSLEASDPTLPDNIRVSRGGDWIEVTPATAACARLTIAPESLNVAMVLDANLLPQGNSSESRKLEVRSSELPFGVALELSAVGGVLPGGFSLGFWGGEHQQVDLEQGQTVRLEITGGAAATDPNGPSQVAVLAKATDGSWVRRGEFLLLPPTDQEDSFDPPRPPSAPYTVTAGWNLLAGGPGSDILGQTAFGYTGSSYESTTGDALQAGKGYWVKFASAGTVNVAVVSPPVSAHLLAGWNLIGNPTAMSLSLPAGFTGFVFEEGSYVSRTVLDPGRGAWVKSSSEQDVVLQ